MRIGLFARRTPTPEPQHERYRREMLRRGHVVVDIDVGAFVSGPCSFFVGGAERGAGLGACENIDVLLVGALPGPAARTGPDDEVVSGAVHAARTRTQYERHLLARALVVELEARGVPCVSPSSSFAFDNKATQLFTLARAGLPLPPTHIGDSVPPAAGAWIAKPISSGRARRSTSTTAELGAPRIVQQRIEGDDLRAIVVGGVCLGIGRFPARATSSQTFDLRDRPGFNDGSQPWLWDRDEAVADAAVRAAAACHVDVAAVDLMRGDAGLFVLEVNRTPVIADLGEDLGIDVDGAVVDLLERRMKGPPAPPKPGGNRAP